MILCCLASPPSRLLAEDLRLLDQRERIFWAMAQQAAWALACWCQRAAPAMLGPGGCSVWVCLTATEELELGEFAAFIISSQQAGSLSRDRGYLFCHLQLQSWGRAQVIGWMVPWNLGIPNKLNIRHQGRLVPMGSLSSLDSVSEQAGFYSEASQNGVRKVIE